jgi:hypothetical protein
MMVGIGDAHPGCRIAPVGSGIREIKTDFIYRRSGQKAGYTISIFDEPQGSNTRTGTLGNNRTVKICHEHYVVGDPPAVAGAASRV